MEEQALQTVAQDIADALADDAKVDADSVEVNASNGTARGADVVVIKATYTYDGIKIVDSAGFNPENAEWNAEQAGRIVGYWLSEMAPF